MVEKGRRSTEGKFCSKKGLFGSVYNNNERDAEE